MNFPKYVIMEFNGTTIIRVLQTHENHYDVVNRRSEVVSAGFFQLHVKNDKVDVECFGESTSLKVTSRPEEDAFILRRFLCLED